jgi:hypothetical protein
MQVGAARPDVIRPHVKLGLGLGSGLEKLVVQGVGDAPARPRPADHDLAQRERRDALPDGRLGDRETPDLADGLLIHIGDDEVKPGMRGVTIETLHEGFGAVKGITRGDGLGVRIDMNEVNRVPQSARPLGVIATERQIRHDLPLLPGRVRR